MSSRQFRWFDALILFAATLAAVVMSQPLRAVQGIFSMETIHMRGGRGVQTDRTAANAVYHPGEQNPVRRTRWETQAAIGAQYLALWPCPALAAFSIAGIVMMLLTPHRSGRGRPIRPALLAGWAFVVALIGTPTVYPQTLYSWHGPAAGWEVHWRDWWVGTCFSLPKTAALAIAVSWLTLGLTGRFRGGTGWLDRFGMAIGMSWIVLGSISTLAAWLTVFRS